MTDCRSCGPQGKESNPVRERIGEIIGGKVLKLASERFIEEGDLKRAKKTTFNMLKDGEPIDRVARFLEFPADTIRTRSREADILL